ncbi:MAG: tetratricopeptide repeat protein, partial [Alphaproteobacteria bacterium]|nr:tetratricopeptide repeat protein [Alphaproteobacteria bacterium]
MTAASAPFPESDFATSHAAHKAGQIAEAEAGYRAILEKAPDHAPTLQFFGVLLAQKGNPAGAAPLIERAIALRPRDAAARINLGNVLRDLGRKDEAIRAYQAGLALDPGLHEAERNLGGILEEEKRFEDAEGHFRRAVGIKANYAEGWWMLGRFLARRGRRAEAGQALRRARELDGGLFDQAMKHGGTLLGRR